MRRLYCRFKQGGGGNKRAHFSFLSAQSRSALFCDIGERELE